jgi:RHS repeat-associated protein
LATVEADKINYHTPDHLGSPRILTDASGQVISRRDFFPFGEQMDASLGNRSSVQGYIPSNDFIKHKFTGYFRDDESGLDFAGARHFASPLGRFMQPDENLVDQIEDDPQSWNLYNYVRNNPNKYVDPSGKGPETLWDAFNVGLGVKSFVDNVKKGNYKAAAVDAIGIVIDSAATITPLVPGGAGTIIKVGRGADKVVDTIRNADKATDAAKAIDKTTDATKLADKTTDAVKNAEGDKKGGNLVRFGKGPETTKQLADDAANAEKHGFPHGVSTKQVDRVSGSDKKHRSAPRSEVEKHFKVEQTGKNPAHHTVHLPKPVTQDVADKFNQVFKPVKD